MIIPDHRQEDNSLLEEGTFPVLSLLLVPQKSIVWVPKLLHGCYGWPDIGIGEVLNKKSRHDNRNGILKITCPKN